MKHVNWWLARPLGSLFVVAGCLALPSCGPSGPRLYPVTGQVLFEDKPAAGATVVFHLVGGSADAPKPGATVKDDGSFTLNSYPHGAGAPEGDYTVLVTWFEESKNENADPKSRIPTRYADPAKSGLKAAVKPGTNALEPFKLTKKP
jgi:hypothetical protein